MKVNDTHKKKDCQKNRKKDTDGHREKGVRLHGGQNKRDGVKRNEKQTK